MADYIQRAIASTRAYTLQSGATTPGGSPVRGVRSEVTAAGVTITLNTADVGTFTWTADELLSDGFVNAVAAKSSGDIKLTSSKDLKLASASPEASELGVDFHGITSGGKVTLTANSISQDYDAPVNAQTLVLQTSGAVHLGDSSDNHVATLEADGVASLHYRDSGTLFVESATLASNGGDVRILIEKDWQCLAPRDEDESDAFPHPRAK